MKTFLNIYKITSLSIGLVLFFYTFSLLGQNLLQLELMYQNKIQEIQIKQTKLDSLNSIYYKMIDSIDKEKQKDSSNENAITRMLAEAVVVSNQVDKQQIILDENANELEMIKKYLDLKYAIKIDSLEALEKENSKVINIETIKSQKMEYIEKRMLVAPKIYSLSFDPQKLIQYNIENSQDSIEQKIYTEYLTNALKEIEKQSQQITVLKSEIQEIVTLQNETADFIEDAESEIMFNPAIQSTQSLEKSSDQFFGGITNRASSEADKLYSQANSYLHIFNQLKTSTNISTSSPWEIPTDTIPANLSFQQYLNLLENLDKMLQDYRVLLEHKLESN